MHCIVFLLEIILRYTTSAKHFSISEILRIRKTIIFCCCCLFQISWRNLSCKIADCETWKNDIGARFHACIQLLFYLFYKNNYYFWIKNIKHNKLCRKWFATRHQPMIDISVLKKYIIMSIDNNYQWKKNNDIIYSWIFNSKFSVIFLRFQLQQIK